MLKDNKLIINGHSTAEFPFLVAVEENPEPTLAKKKNKLFESDHLSGYMTRKVNAYESVVKEFKIYLYNVTAEQIRQFKLFIYDEGWFQSADDNLKYYYDSVDFESSVLDETDGYLINLRFRCQPFGYETERRNTLGVSLNNHTNAPMYPRLEFNVTGNRAYLQMGDIRMDFLDLQGQRVTVECAHGKQDVTVTGGRKVNANTRGNFFVVKPRQNVVIEKSNVSNVTITERWCWR